MSADERRKEIAVEAVKAIISEFNRAHGTGYQYVSMEEVSRNSAPLLPIIEIALLKAELEGSRREKK